MKFSIICILSVLLVAGCSFNTDATSYRNAGNPTAKDILNDNPDADILQYGSIIYSNGSDLKWVQENGYKKGEQVGEIIRKTNKSSQFKSGVASKLPVGTKIFKTESGSNYTLIVNYNDQQIIYIALIEG